MFLHIFTEQTKREVLAHTKLFTRKYRWYSHIKATWKTHGRVLHVPVLSHTFLCPKVMHRDITLPTYSQQIRSTSPHGDAYGHIQASPMYSYTLFHTHHIPHKCITELTRLFHLQRVNKNLGFGRVRGREKGTPAFHIHFTPRWGSSSLVLKLEVATTLQASFTQFLPPSLIFGESFSWLPVSHAQAVKHKSTEEYCM